MIFEQDDELAEEILEKKCAPLKCILRETGNNSGKEITQISFNG